MSIFSIRLQLPFCSGPRRVVFLKSLFPRCLEFSFLFIVYNYSCPLARQSHILISILQLQPVKQVHSHALPVSALTRPGRATRSPTVPTGLTKKFAVSSRP